MSKNRWGELLDDESLILELGSGADPGIQAAEDEVKKFFAKSVAGRIGEFGNALGESKDAAGMKVLFESGIPTRLDSASSKQNQETEQSIGMMKTAIARFRDGDKK